MAALSHVGPWAYYQHGPDTVAFISDGTGPKPLSAFNAPRTVNEGLSYCGPLSLPDQADLARDIAMDTDRVLEMSTGVHLSIPVALYSARSIDFTNDTEGDYATEFGRAAARIYDQYMSSDDLIPAKEVSRIVYLAIAQRYRVTRELLTDLPWITTDDIMPILNSVFGIDMDPKPSSADGES